MYRLKYHFFYLIFTVVALEAAETSFPRKKALIFGITVQDGAY
jgi:hypothetical protein